MMQTTSVPTGLSALLSQILGSLDGSGVQRLGGADGTGSLDQADVGKFVQSLAGQLKLLMVERGADPVEVAVIADETLVAEFFALVQGQMESPPGGLSVTTGLGELMCGFEASAVPMEEDRVCAETSSGDAPEQESEAPAWLAALPIVVLERLTEAGRMLPTPASAPAAPSDSEPVDLETLTRALLRQVTPSANRDRDAEQSSVPDTPKPTESASILPVWLARQLNSDDAQTYLNTAVSVTLPSNAASDSASPSIGETLRGLATNGEQTIQSTSDLETVLESTELNDVTPMGAPRTPTATADTATIGTRLQPLDLNRLLQPGGEQRLVEQVRWSVDQGLDTAEIKLHPPSLGTLDVRLVQEGDKTHVQFISAHPIAREVLEAAMPRLREALAQDGVLLGNVSVSDQAPSDRGEAGRERGQSAGTGDHEAEDDEDRIESIATLSVLSRRLDVFT